MKYRIEYTGGRCSSLVNNRQELLRQVKAAAPGSIEDIRKLYKNGISDSVMEKYEQLFTTQENALTSVGALIGAGNP